MGFIKYSCQRFWKNQDLTCLLTTSFLIGMIIWVLTFIIGIILMITESTKTWIGLLLMFWYPALFIGGSLVFMVCFFIVILFHGCMNIKQNYQEYRTDYQESLDNGKREISLQTQKRAKSRRKNRSSRKIHPVNFFG